MLLPSRWQFLADDFLIGPNNFLAVVPLPVLIVLALLVAFRLVYHILLARLVALLAALARLLLLLLAEQFVVGILVCVAENFTFPGEGRRKLKGVTHNRLPFYSLEIFLQVDAHGADV